MKYDLHPTRQRGRPSSRDGRVSAFSKQSQPTPTRHGLALMPQTISPSPLLIKQGLVFGVAFLFQLFLGYEAQRR